MRKIFSQHISSSKAISSLCGYCNKPISLDVNYYYYTSEYPDGSGTKNYLYYTGTCPICGKPIIHKIDDNSVLPTIRGFENVLHLPKDVETLYNEMRDAFSAKSYTCCVIAGRTLLANIAVEQGDSAGKGFIDYVNFLVNNCLPKSSSMPWVDKVRKLGNNSAHNLVIAKKEDAELSLKFLTAILKNIYEFPNSI